MALILDTGPLYASLDRSDADYAACRELIEDTVEPLVIPAPVLVELDYWVHIRLHPGVFNALLDDIIAGAYRVEALQPEDYGRIRELCDRYADADVGFVDSGARRNRPSAFDNRMTMGGVFGITKKRFSRQASRFPHT